MVTKKTPPNNSTTNVHIITFNLGWIHDHSISLMIKTGLCIGKQLKLHQRSIKAFNMNLTNPLFKNTFIIITYELTHYHVQIIIIYETMDPANNTIYFLVQILLTPIVSLPKLIL